MTTYLRKTCSFGFLCVSFVNVYQIVCDLLSLFYFFGGMWDLIVLIPGHCLFIYLCKDPYIWHAFTERVGLAFEHISQIFVYIMSPAWPRINTHFFIHLYTLCLTYILDKLAD